MSKTRKEVHKSTVPLVAAKQKPSGLQGNHPPSWLGSPQALKPSGLPGSDRDKQRNKKRDFFEAGG